MLGTHGVLRSNSECWRTTTNNSGRQQTAVDMQTSLATTNTNNPVAEPDKRPSITRKVREAIDAMVWLGLPRDKAAEKAGISDHGLYKALRSPPVKAHYLAECEVLRTSGRARRIHRLEAMVEQDDNKAAVVNAALALERMSPDDVSQRASSGSPGMVVVVVGHPPLIGHDRPISPKPLIDHDPVHDGGS